MKITTILKCNVHKKKLKCQKLCSKKHVCSTSPLFKIGSLFCYLYKTGNSISSRFKVYIVNAFSNESSSQRRTSCWMLAFKVPMNTSILCSSRIFVLLIFNFWKSSLQSIIEPFCFRFINWLKKLLLFVSS